MANQRTDRTLRCDMDRIRAGALDGPGNLAGRRQGKPDFRIGGHGYRPEALRRQEGNLRPVTWRFLRQRLQRAYDAIHLGAPRVRRYKYAIGPGTR